MLRIDESYRSLRKDGFLGLVQRTTSSSSLASFSLNFQLGLNNFTMIQLYRMIIKIGRFRIPWWPTPIWIYIVHPWNGITVRVYFTAWDSIEFNERLIFLSLNRLFLNLRLFLTVFSKRNPLLVIFQFETKFGLLSLTFQAVGEAARIGHCYSIIIQNI